MENEKYTVWQHFMGSNHGNQIAEFDTPEGCVAHARELNSRRASGSPDYYVACNPNYSVIDCH